MKASWKCGPKVIVEAEGETVKQVFERLGDLAGVLGAASKCGCCGSDQIIPQVRRPDNFTYYSLACLACKAELKFGQTREGERLFPKTEGDHGGWSIYQGGQSGYAAPAVARGPAPKAYHDDGQEQPF